MVCMRDERLARCSCRHPVIINLNLLSLFSWHHPFSSICHHDDVTLYQFWKVLNLKTLFVLLSMSNCNRLQAIQPFIREPVQKFQAEKKVHKNQNLFFNIQRVPSNTFLQQVAFKSRPLVYLSYPSTFFWPCNPKFSAAIPQLASIKPFAKTIFSPICPAAAAAGQASNYLQRVFTNKRFSTTICERYLLKKKSYKTISYFQPRLFNQWKYCIISQSISALLLLVQP